MLGLAVASMLFAALPDEDEGTLSRRLSDLVRAETCAEVAVELGLGEGVQVGPTESQSAVGKRAGVLADLCEAVTGAIHLDAGWEPAEAFVMRNWRARLTAGASPQRDAKSALQEWAQGRGLATPVYRVVSRSGPDHAPMFTMAVVIPGLADGIGEGPAARRGRDRGRRVASWCREGVWSPGKRHGSADMSAEPTRCGFVAIIGAPNAGKSTLVNALVGAKVTIVSHKVQTTRSLVRGIAMEGGSQIILRRHAGSSSQPRRRLDRAMVSAAWRRGGEMPTASSCWS